MFGPMMAGISAIAPSAGIMSSLGSIGSFLGGGEGLGSILGGIGGLFGGKSSGAAKEARHIQYDTWQMNKDLAYNGVQRRVEDANKAGVHPLAALGMNPYQGSVASVVGDTEKRSAIGRLAQAGSDISRGLAAGQSTEERSFTKTMAALQLERGGLENELLRSQIAGQRAQLAPSLNLGSDTGGLDPRYLTQLRQQLGLGDQLPLFKQTKDGDGRTIRVWNDDAGDNEAMQILTLPVSAYDMTKNLGRKTGDFIRKHFTW